MYVYNMWAIYLGKIILKNMCKKFRSVKLLKISKNIIKNEKNFLKIPNKLNITKIKNCKISLIH